MTIQQKADWVRRIIVTCLFSGAIAGGFLLVGPEEPPAEVPEVAAPRKPREGLQVTPGNIAEIKASPGRLTVVNTFVDDNPDCEKLKEILVRLKKEKYGDRLRIAELDTTAQPELAASEGIDTERFSGLLDFHRDGRNVAELADETDPEVVEGTIDRLLQNPISRVHKGWLPAVQGLERKQEH